jgi:hypothetical protein
MSTASRTPQAPPELERDHVRLQSIADTLRDAFWVFAVSIVACFLFFVLLGALHPGQVIGLTIAMIVLAALYAGHAYMDSRAREARGRDPRLVHARERRGF